MGFYLPYVFRRLRKRENTKKILYDSMSPVNTLGGVLLIFKVKSQFI